MSWHFILNLMCIRKVECLFMGGLVLIIITEGKLCDKNSIYGED